MSTLNYEDIGRRLKRIRNAMALSQKEMGNKLEIGAFYGNIERAQDRASDQALINIADKLNVDFEWIRSGLGPEPDILLKYQAMPGQAPENSIKSVPTNEDDIPKKGAENQFNIREVARRFTIRKDVFLIDMEIDLQERTTSIKSNLNGNNIDINIDHDSLPELKILIDKALLKSMEVLS